jgi:hypothetical protein
MCENCEENYVIAIKASEQVALLADNTTRPFDMMFDEDGDETDDPDEAVAAIVQLSDDAWDTFTFDEFEPVFKQ